MTGGLITDHTVLVIDCHPAACHIRGSTAQPEALCMGQVVRTLRRVEGHAVVLGLDWRSGSDVER